MILTAALSHRWAHQEPSAFQWILLFLFLPLLFTTLERGGRQKENEISTPVHLSGAFFSTYLHHACFTLLFCKGEAQTSEVCAGCLNAEQLMLSSFYEGRTKSSTFMDIRAVQPTWKLKLQSRCITSAQQTKTQSTSLKEKKMCICKLKRMLLVCFLMAPLP